MGWNDVDLKNVSPTIEPVAEGNYTLQLLPGAKFSEQDSQKIEASAAITDGEFAGRKLFFTYPDPAKFDWSPRVFKRLVNSLGVDMTEGEGPTEYLNRAAGQRFAGPVRHRKYTAQDGTEVTKAELVIFNLGPAA